MPVGRYSAGRWMRGRKRRWSSSCPMRTQHAPLEVCVFNIGANVNFPIIETTERVFRKVWEMACYSGFSGRARIRPKLMLRARQRQHIFFTGATASMRGGLGIRCVCQRQIWACVPLAQSMARELGPQ